MSSSSSSTTPIAEGKKIELDSVGSLASTTEEATAAAAATGAAVADKSSLAKQPDMGEIKAAPDADAGQWIKGYDNQTVMLAAGGLLLLFVLMKKSGGNSAQTQYIPMPFR
jgi:hypothetical protein